MRDYYNDIPIGKGNAITKEALCKLWGVNERQTRRIIQDLRNEDNGDGFVIVTTSKGSGYFRSDDPNIISDYIKETQERASNTLLPMKKAKRILREHNKVPAAEVGAVVCKLHDFREGVFTQSHLVKQVQKKYPMFDRMTLSKAENGLTILPPDILAEVSRLLNITPRDIYPSMLTEYKIIMEDR